MVAVLEGPDFLESANRSGLAAKLQRLDISYQKRVAISQHDSASKLSYFVAEHYQRDDAFKNRKERLAELSSCSQSFGIFIAKA